MNPLNSGNDIMNGFIYQGVNIAEHPSLHKAKDKQ